MAMQHTLRARSSKSTYPVPLLLDNYIKIKNVYNLLNEHIKLGISIHPAGEWILDNFYIIEESVRQIEKEITIKNIQILLEYKMKNTKVLQDYMYQQQKQQHIQITK